MFVGLENHPLVNQALCMHSWCVSLNSFFYFLYTIISLNSFLVFTYFMGYYPESLVFQSFGSRSINPFFTCYIPFIYICFSFFIEPSSYYLVLDGILLCVLLFVLLLLLTVSILHLHELVFFSALSVLIFSASFPSCCWYSVVILGSFNLPILNLLGFLFISLFLCAILYL